MKVLIADSGKASLVMTSEIFKDFFPGVQVFVAKTANDALEIAKNNTNLDAVVLDFDLPDRNGAETAAKIKKISNVPVLITGFDRPEVHEVIEREVAAYDDCLSWMKKPVRPEVVVDIVRRFCEGKYRTKRRLVCAVPALVELAVKGTKTSKDKRSSVWVPVIVEDSSLGGIKMRVLRDIVSSLENSTEVKAAEKALKLTDTITIQLPSFEDIAKGNTEKWLDSFLVEDKPKGKTIAAKSKTKTKAKKAAPALLRVLKPTTQRTLEKESVLGSALKGKVVWYKNDGADLLIGMESDSATLMKRLFDSLLQAAKWDVGNAA